MKVYNGTIIGAENAEQRNAAKKELLSQGLKNKRQRKSKDGDAVVSEASQETTMQSRLSVRRLLVTPEEVVVEAGQKTSLRVRCNCAWHIVSQPEAAVVVAPARCFGNGVINVTAPDDAMLDGQLVIRTDDNEIEATVSFIDEYPAPDPNIELLSE